MTDQTRRTCIECRYFVGNHCTNDRTTPFARQMASAGREACVDFKERRDRVIETAHNQREELRRLNKENETLRKHLFSACVELCHDCESCRGYSKNYTCVSKAGDCFVQEWRRAVGMDGGFAIADSRIYYKQRGRHKLTESELRKALIVARAQLYVERRKNRKLRGKIAQSKKFLRDAIKALSNTQVARIREEAKVRNGYDI